MRAWQNFYCCGIIAAASHFPSHPDIGEEPVLAGGISTTLMDCACSWVPPMAGAEGGTSALCDTTAINGLQSGQPW